MPTLYTTRVPPNSILGSALGIIGEAACCPLCRARHKGHGYCTYDFFDQCPHRMACAKCSFYMPKGSTASALLEGKNNLLRMRQEIPLTDAEAAAVDDGASALDSLLKRLANVPTPAGPTPLQLSDGATTASEAAD
jgi:hypothetical protein